VGLLVCAGAALRVLGLGDKPFWLGEIQEIVAARSPRFLDQLVDSGTDVVGFFWHNAVWLMGLPPQEAVSRLPAAIVSVALLPVVYRLGVLLHSRLAGLIALAFLAFSFFHIQFSQDARSAAYLTFFMTLSWLAMLELFLKGTRQWALVFAVSAGLAGLSHGLGAVHLLFQGAFFLTWAFRHEPRTTNHESRILASGLTYLLPAAGAALIASFQFTVLSDYGFASVSTPVPVTSTFDWDDLFLLRVFLAHLAAPSAAVMVIHCLLAAFGLFMLSGKGSGWRPALLSTWFLGPAAAIYLLSTAGGTSRMEMYHLLPILPPFLLASAAGLASLAPLTGRLLRRTRTHVPRPAFQSSSLPAFQSSSLPPFQSSSLPPFQSSSLPPFQSSSLPASTWLLLGIAVLLQASGNGSAITRYHERPTRLFHGPDMRAAGAFLDELDLGSHDVVFLNYSEHMVPANFYAGRTLKRATVVVPWRPPDPDWQSHLLIRAHFQAIDSDVERLLPDEIAAVDELPAIEAERQRRGVCILFWPEGSQEHKGLADYMAWLNGDMLYVRDHAIPETSVTEGWTLHRFPGVDVLVSQPRPTTIRTLADQVLPLLNANAPPMLKDMAPSLP